MNITDEDRFWMNADPDELWVMDKLILSRKLGYTCGPVGQDVPKPGIYIVRPCVNMLGLGLGASKHFIAEETVDYPVGYFWCEWFEGRHISIDYHFGVPYLSVEGFKADTTFTHWDKWVKIDEHFPLPDILKQFSSKEWINCEFIGDKLIEVHFRKNPDFENNITEFIPVWKGQDTTPPENYKYIEYPDIHGRIGAFVK